MIKKLVFSIVLVAILSVFFSFAVSAQAVNILDPEKLGNSPQTENNGITYVYNGDGSFTLNGTATASSAYAFLPESHAIAIEPGDYVISTMGITGGRVNVKIVENTGVSYTSSATPCFFTVDESCRIRGSFLIETGVTLDNVVIKPYIIKLDVADYGTPATFEEYMATSEYAAAMREEFNRGAEFGYSSGEAQGKTVGYNEGFAEGYSNYKYSVEYSDELNNSYSEGYNVGYLKGEEDSTLNGIFGVLLPSVLISAAFSLILIFIKSRKKKKRR